MAFRDRSNRVYDIIIREEDILTLLGEWRYREHICLPTMTGAVDFSSGKMVDIPKDTRIEQVVYDHRHQAFVVRISHPSFTEKDDGVIPPLLNLTHIAVRSLPVTEVVPDGKVQTIKGRGIDCARPQNEEIDVGPCHKVQASERPDHRQA